MRGRERAHDFMRGCPDDCIGEHPTLCPFGEGELQLCRFCVLAEASLTTECPGPKWEAAFLQAAKDAGVHAEYNGSAQPTTHSFCRWALSWDDGRTDYLLFDFVRGAWRFWAKPAAVAARG